MFSWLAYPSLLRTFALLGSLVILLGALLPAILYRGRQGERYSPFNHFISELGEIGVSRLAPIFNAGLFLGGLFFLPVSLGLGLLLPGWWSKLGMLAGCVASLAVALVGVFPMNNMHPHILAAMTYFRSGLVMVVFFSLAVAFQPAGEVLIHKSSLGISLLSAGFYAAFLFMGRGPEGDSQAEENGDADPLDPSVLPERPKFWLLPTIEWAIFVTSILWFLIISLGIKA